MSRIRFLLTILSSLILIELVTGESGGSLRLVSDCENVNRSNSSNGTLCDQSTGLLEIFLNGQWGTVCNDNFGEIEATLACYQLGYSSLLRLFTTGMRIHGVPSAPPNTPIWLSGVDCFGPGDLAIFNCPHDQVVSGDCNHIRDVALSCTGPYSITPGSVRLVPITENFDSSISYTAGRVEIFYNGQWGSICSRSVNKATADALCAEVTGDGTSLALVHGTAGSSGLQFSAPGSEDTPIWEQFSCSTSLGLCQRIPHTQGGSCVHSDDLAISCVGDGAVRLLASSSASRDDGGGSAGRLEVYQDGEWRSVCENRFTPFEATAVCLQLGYMPHDSMIYITDYGDVNELGFPSGSSSVWQDSADCSPSDSVFIECGHRGILRTCDQSEYIAVSCTGPISNSGLDRGAQFLLTFFGSVGLFFCILTATILPIMYFCCRRFNKRHPHRATRLIASGTGQLPSHTHASVSEAEKVGSQTIKSTRLSISQDKEKTSRTLETRTVTENMNPYPQNHEHRAEIYQDEAPPSYDMAAAYPLVRVGGGISEHL